MGATSRQRQAQAHQGRAPVASPLSHMKIRNQLIAAFILACGASGAWACRAAADDRPAQVRYQAAPVAFIGTVISARDEEVTFEVEHALRGASAGRTTIALPKPYGSSCTTRFHAGQRWLYAGPTVMDPSVLIPGILDSGSKPNPSSPAHRDRLMRAPDEHLSLPAKLQSCTADSQCQAFPYGCSVTAANGAGYEEAKALAWERGGDPRAMNCASFRNPGSHIHLGALCVAGRCGAWSIDASGLLAVGGEAPARRERSFGAGRTYASTR